MNYDSLLRQTIDLHVHIGPEIIPRKFTLPELIAAEAGRLKGVGVKHHFFPTVTMPTPPSDLVVIHSIALNHYVGGFNSDAVRAAAELSERPIIVWFPTIHAAEFLRGQELEIPAEWIGPKKKNDFRPRPARDIQGLSIWDNDQIIEPVRRVLEAIHAAGAILATGHLSWQESRALVQFAVQQIGLKKIIVTHPIYQRINMPLEVQAELAGLGSLMEHSFSMHAIDKQPIEKIVQQIRSVGPEHCILSSDVGQAFSKQPSEALAEFIQLLTPAGVSEREIGTMLVDNPNRLAER